MNLEMVVNPINGNEYDIGIVEFVVDNITRRFEKKNFQIWFTEFISNNKLK